MASSFLSQIEPVINLVRQLSPHRILDIGKGFGKYGFLLHEYCGIDSRRRPDPSKTLAEQSAIDIDAVESNPDYLWPHLSHIYRRVFLGRIESLYRELRGYDLVLMLDVIEHLSTEHGRLVVDHFVRDGASVIISTPVSFFDQELYQSEDEHHLSLWNAADFKALGFNVDHQTAGPGRIFLVSSRRLDVRGFGNKPIKRLRRIARGLKSELLT